MVDEMLAPAHRRVHIVVLSSDELENQLDRGRDTFSFAVDRSVGSPGNGRIAVVVTRETTDGGAITHLGRVRSGGARTNLDATWVLSSLHELQAPITIADLSIELGPHSEVVREAATRRRGGSLAPAASAALQEAIQARIGTNDWPAADGKPEWMKPMLDGEIRQSYTNAVGTALMFSDMNLAHMRTAPLPAESPLATLRLAPSEPSLIDHDLRNFPSMDDKPLREDIVRFTDNKHVLDVMNVNATSIESATGVDLVYFNHEYESYVFVQYKRMVNHEGGRVADIDSRLPDQLRRMVAVDKLGAEPAEELGPETYRLGTGSTFTKFAYPVVSPIREADLTRGLYVPSDLLRRLYTAGQLKGPRGGDTITHGNLRRWISNDQFAELVKNGWVGSSGISATDIHEFVAATLSEGRIALIAAHSTGGRQS